MDGNKSIFLILCEFWSTIKIDELLIDIEVDLENFASFKAPSLWDPLWSVTTPANLET